MEKSLNLFIGISITIYLLGFFIKNIITSKRIGQPIKGKSRKVKSLIIIISILYVLSYISIFFTHHILYSIDIFDGTLVKIIGVVLVAGALLIGISTLITMSNSWRMGITEEQNTGLITNGLFRYCRNPYFLSYYLIFLGVFLVFPTVIFLLFYIPSAIITHTMVLDEEKFLRKLHGKQYLDYKNSVSRYIPLRILKKRDF